MVTVTFAGCGDAFGSGGRFQACIHLRPEAPGAPAALAGPVLLDCGATSLAALRRCGLADMLARQHLAVHDTARDGLVITA